MRSARALVLAVLVSACTTPRTEILVVTSTDFAIPSELDAFQIDVTGPGSASQSSTASLGMNGAPPPRTLGLVYDEGRLGPYQLRIQGMHAGVPVITRAAEVSFQPQKTLVLRVDLTRDCLGVSCGDEQTCSHGACRPVAIDPSELAPFEGELPGADAAMPATDGGPGRDAGPALDGGPARDAGCDTPEVCNGEDDDCDGRVDETFDLTSDPSHCGSCDTACAAAHGTAECADSECSITSCEAGFDDCDGDATNGCEADLTSDDTCGSCDTVCHGMNHCCATGGCDC